MTISNESKKPVIRPQQAYLAAVRLMPGSEMTLQFMFDASIAEKMIEPFVDMCANSGNTLIQNKQNPFYITVTALHEFDSVLCSVIDYLTEELKVHPKLIRVDTTPAEPWPLLAPSLNYLNTKRQEKKYEEYKQSLSV